MFVYTYLLLAIALFWCNGQQSFFHNRFRRLNQPSGLKLKQRLQEKLNQYRQRSIETICYDTVGCFEVPHRRSPFQKVPESPSALDTKFYLFKRDINFAKPELIYYDDDGESLAKSKFNYSLPLKLIVHGYMGKWNDYGQIVGANSYLKIYDCNMIVMDWSKGAKGPQYTMAAANTEVVGRQLGILLLKMVENGLKPENIHLLGFSLGAHIAGTSSEVLKKKGYLIGRITGLDAASPLFRTNHLREPHKKLDKEDAHFVDVLHTDSSPSVTDGFGLWQPIGHVDFFPNGGQEQPGCTDAKQSIVVSHFDQSLTREIACSHIRAWRLFEETLLTTSNPNSANCRFIAFNCPGGLKSFERGFCFPNLPNPNSSLALEPAFRSEIGQFGEKSKGEGIMFFVTKASAPYCGTQIQASVHISSKTVALNGIMVLKLQYSEHSALININCNSKDVLMTGNVMNGLGVVDFESLNNLKIIPANLKYFDSEYDENNSTVPFIYFNKVVIRDMYNNKWEFCKKDTLLGNPSKMKLDINISLKKDSCFG